MCCKKNQVKGFFLLLSTLSTNSLPKTKDHSGVRRKPSLVPLQLLGRACLPTSASPPLRPLLPSTNPKPCGMGRVWGTGRGSDQRFCYSLNPDLSLLQLGLVWEAVPDLSLPDCAMDQLTGEAGSSCLQIVSAVQRHYLLGLRWSWGRAKLMPVGPLPSPLRLSKQQGGKVLERLETWVLVQYLPVKHAWSI